MVDPLDGTVNYFYGIPHYAVSIAAQERRGHDQWETVMGVVLAPELDELFATEKGKPAMLHGQPIHVSNRTELSEAIVAIGFFKSLDAMNRSLQDFGRMIYKVRKMRLTGSAALDTVVRGVRPLRWVHRVQHPALGHRRGPAHPRKRGRPRGKPARRGAAFLRRADVEWKDTAG